MRKEKTKQLLVIGFSGKTCSVMQHNRHKLINLKSGNSRQ